MLIALAKKGQHNDTTNPETRKKIDEVIFLPGVLQVYQSPIVGTLRQSWIEGRKEKRRKDQRVKRASVREREREKDQGTRFEYKPRFRSRVPRYA